MARLYNNETGQVEEVPDAIARDALVSQKYGIPNDMIHDGTVNMIDADGFTRSYSLADAPAMAQAGHRFETPSMRAERIAWDEAKDSGGKAFLHSALGTATLGASTWAIGKVSPKTLEDLELAKQANPVWSGAGMITGSLLPGGIAGKAVQGVGKAAASKIAGEAAKQTLVRKALSKAASGAIEGVAEGVALGAGDVFNEAALGNIDLTGENFVKGVTMGAILGGTVGGALGGAMPALGAGASKAAGGAKAAGKNIGERIASSQVLKSVSATRGQGAKMAKKFGAKWDDVSHRLANYTDDAGEKLIQFGDDAEAVADRAIRMTDDVGEKIGSLRRTMDEIEQANPSGKLSKKVSELIEEIEEGISNQYLSSDVAGQQAKGASALRQIEGIKSAIDAGEPITFDRLHRLSSDLKKQAYPKNPLTAPDFSDALVDIERKVETFIEKEGESLFKEFAPELADTYKAAKSDYAALRTYSEIAKKQAGRDLGGRTFSLTDNIMGSVSGATGFVMGGPVGIATAAGGALVNKIGRDYGSSAILAGGRAMGRHLRELAIKNNRAMRVQSGGVTQFLSPSDKKPKLRSAAVSSSVVLSDPIFPGAGGGKVANSQEGAKKRGEELANAVARPERTAAVISKATSGIESEAPRTSEAIARTVANGLMFLHEKAPKAPSKLATLQPMLDSDWLPTKQEAARFARYVRAVKDPKTVMDDLLNGTLSFEAVEALEAVYPQTYESLKMQLVEEAAKLDKPIPYRNRLQLSLLFKTPLDPSLLPEAIQRAQGAYAKKQPQGQGPQGIRLTGLKELDGISDDRATPMQRLESKD